MELKFITENIHRTTDSIAKRRLFKKLLIKIKNFSRGEIVKNIVVGALSSLLGGLALKVIFGF